MLSSPQTVTPKPALPPVAPPATTANAAPAAGGPSFAQFLTDRAGPPASPPTAAEPDAEQAQASKARAAPRRPPQQPAARPAAQPGNGRTGPDAEATAAGAGRVAATSETDAVAHDGDADDAAETPELKEFTQLLGMAPPQSEVAAVRPDARHPAADKAATVAADAGHDDRRARADTGRAGKGVEVLKASDARADKASLLAAEDGKAAVQAAGPGAEATHAPASPIAPSATTSFAAVLAQSMPTPAAPADAAPASTQAIVQAPLHTAAFAPEVGARISLLAVEGIQQAELQLNPADMGPVAVQIVVDGNQAQVSFHAVQAETRQALEQSLPDLAAALQGQGLTLSGGGVFQQAARDMDHGRDGGQAGSEQRAAGSRSGNAAPGSPVTAAPARRSVGLLDTFA